VGRKKVKESRWMGRIGMEGVVQKIKQGGGSHGAGWRWSRCGGHALGVLSPEEGDNGEKKRGAWVKGYGLGRGSRMGHRVGLEEAGAELAGLIAGGDGFGPGRRKQARKRAQGGFRALF
jgi:hypothetical protein